MATATMKIDPINREKDSDSDSGPLLLHMGKFKVQQQQKHAETIKIEILR